jgi:nitrogen-specific signal transduction histidine kinase/PAS domain-containing protein
MQSYLVPSIVEALTEANRKNKFNLLLKESRAQKEQLETLNNSLEVIVLDRTQNIEKSRKEEEEKLSRLRTVTRFIKDLSTFESLEETFLYIRKDLRKMIGLCEPFLLFSVSNHNFTLLSFESNLIRQKELSGRLPEIEFKGWANDKLTLLTAKTLGRPVVKPFIVNLEIPSVLQLGNPSARAYLLLECGQLTQDNNQTSLAIENYINEIHEPLSMIFDRLLLESEIVKSSFRWEQTFDNLKDPIAIIDIEYNIIRSNRMFSSSESNEKCHQVFFGNEKPCDNCPISKSKGLSLVKIENSQKTYQLRSYPIVLNPAERPTNFVHQYIDETKSRELYLKLVQNEKLGAIGLLAGNLAHELNNPLTGIYSLAQILKSEATDETLIKDLHEIQNATRRSQLIIQNLLEFSNHDSSKISAVTMDEIVNKTVVFLKMALRQHNYKLDLNNSRLKIKVDPLMFSQVVFNLINNACQAMKSKGDLLIRTWESGQQVFFEVTDSGEGISEQNIIKIFEPFFTTKKEGAGTGLGLSLSKKVVEEFGGKISVVSELSKGSKFTVQMEGF